MRTLRKRLDHLWPCVALTLAVGCNSAKEQKPGKEMTATAKAAVASGLPIRQFVQAPRMCEGAENDLDYFELGGGVRNGALVGRFTAAGRYSLWVRENNGTQTQIAPADFYVDKPLGGITNSFRVVCTTTATLIDRGPGPAGEVFAFDKTQGMQVVCWANPLGTTLWTKTVVASAAAGEPKDAFWLKVVAGADNNGVDIANAFEVVYVRDAEYEPGLDIAV